MISVEHAHASVKASGNLAAFVLGVPMVARQRHQCRAPLCTGVRLGGHQWHPNSRMSSRKREHGTQHNLCDRPLVCYFCSLLPVPSPVSSACKYANRSRSSCGLSVLSRLSGMSDVGDSASDSILSRSIVERSFLADSSVTLPGD